MPEEDIVIDYVVEKYDDSRRELFIWDGSQALDTFWCADYIQDSDKLEQITAVSPSREPEQALLIGLNTGVIDKVTESHCEEVSRFPSLDILSEQERCIEYDNWVNGLRQINSIIKTQDGVYDASAAGLFNTFTGEHVFSGYVTSATIWDNRLCVVPMGLTSAQDTFCRLQSNGLHQGALVDAFTCEEIIKNFAPFDRKTQSQADYLISQDKVYLASGKHPNITVQIKAMPDLEIIREYNIIQHIKFVEYAGNVYHLCRTKNAGLCIYGYAEDDIVYRADSTEEILSLLAFDSLLISTHNHETGASQIKNALTGETLYTQEPRNEFSAARLKLHTACYSW